MSLLLQVESRLREKNVPDVLYFYARTYLPHISDTGYPVVTFKPIYRATSTALQLLPKL